MWPGDLTSSISKESKDIFSKLSDLSEIPNCTKYLKFMEVCTAMTPEIHTFSDPASHRCDLPAQLSHLKQSREESA